jgi:uroporphyrinogen decarboxylase
MNQRERFLAAIRREMPNKVPKYAEFTPRQLEQLKAKTGCDNPAEYFNYEMRAIYFEPTSQHPDYSRYLGELPPGSTITEWGVGEVPGDHYHFTRMVHPMRNFTSVKEIENYPFPDYAATYRHQNLEAKIQAVHAQGLATISRFTMIFEHAWYLRGMENLMLDFFERPDFAEALLDRITDIACFIHSRFAEAGVDLIRTGDDIGTQNGMMISPAMWRRWLKPRLARIIEAAKSVKGDVKVLYDSDGSFDPVIPDLIEVGVDVLAPIQPECNDPAWLKKEYGKQLAFWGSLGVQSTIPYGTPYQVRREVRQRIQTIGKDGGLVIGPSHVIPPEAPWENVMALFDAIEDYGHYAQVDSTN